MTNAPENDSDVTRTVRSRAVWAGTLLALLAIAVVGVGVAVTSWAIAVPGLVALVAACVVAWRAGLMYDAHETAAGHHEAHQVASGGTHEGLSPYQRVTDDQARQRAAESSREARSATSGSMNSPMPSLLPVGAVGVLVLGVWMSFSHMILNYAYDLTPQDAALRATGFGAALTLAGLTLLFRGRSLLATGAALGLGVLLILAGLGLEHEQARTMWNALVSGVLVLGFAALTLPSGLRRPRP